MQALLQIRAASLVAASWGNPGSATYCSHSPLQCAVNTLASFTAAGVGASVERHDSESVQRPGHTQPVGGLRGVRGALTTVLRARLWTIN